MWEVAEGKIYLSFVAFIRTVLHRTRDHEWWIDDIVDYIHPNNKHFGHTHAILLSTTESQNIAVDRLNINIHKSHNDTAAITGLYNKLYIFQIYDVQRYCSTLNIAVFIVLCSWFTQLISHVP
jgi:hypothetical protein